MIIHRYIYELNILKKNAEITREHIFLPLYVGTPFIFPVHCAISDHLYGFLQLRLRLLRLCDRVPLLLFGPSVTATRILDCRAILT